MKHVGDITNLSGHTLPPVDCITGGSPCQDLSVAGLRKGLEGERSGLFMEQIRIVKEMREHDRGNRRTDDICRPRYMVWENVPGAFSSNHGKDFQAVLTEIVRIAEPNAPDVPLPENGKWPKAGCLYDELANWSVAWRTHDSQWWGVPQRRKRISVLADFSGLTAPEIMFDPQYRRTAEDGKPIETFSDIGTEPGQPVQPLSKGLPGDSESGGEERKETARGTGNGSTHAISFQERAGNPGGGKGILIQNEHTGALSTLNNQSVFVPSVGAFNYLMGAKARSIGVQDECSPTLSGERHDASVYCLQGNGIDRADTAGCNGKGWKEDVSYTLNTIDRPAVAYGFEPGAAKRLNTESRFTEETSPTLRSDMGDNQASVISLNDQGGSVMSITKDVTGALRAEEHGHQPVIFHDRDDIHEEHHDEPIMIEMTSTKNTIIEDGISTTLTARMGTGGNQVNAVCMDVGFFQTEEEKAGALLARQYKDPPITYQDKTSALMASGYQKNGTQEAANDMYVTDNLVHRLTPKECERLQAFPDDWTNIGEWTDSKGKKHKDADSPRYKALGNSIALPFWFWLLRRISAQYERPATLGSLFDGIGGFPYCWEKCNGKGSAIWASEIEEFPIAVTKLRFPEREENE